VYYLLQRPSAGSRQELRRLTLETGASEALLPGVPVGEYDVSPDGTHVVYTTAAPAGASQMWLAPLDRATPPTPIGAAGDTSPYFDRNGDILFRVTEGRFNYLARMRPDGTGRSHVVPYPISTIQSISPGRRWIMAVAPTIDNATAAAMAIPVQGGPPVRMCEIYCDMAWSADGRFVLLSVEEPSTDGPGRTLAIPTGPGEALPAFPPLGIPPLAAASVMPGARSIPRAPLVPGSDPDTFLYVRTQVHGNLFRVTLH
jgi:hypothetical protein